MLSYSPAAKPANPAPLPSPFRLRWWERGFAILIGGCAIALLITASRLKPSPQGFGTHRQLGLARCTMIEFAGIRCPACGMTTSWSHFTRGNLVSAAKTNSGGLMLAIAAILLGPWLLVSGLLGRWWLIPFREGPIVAVLVVMVVITLIDWGVRLSIDVLS